MENQICFKAECDPGIAGHHRTIAVRKQACAASRQHLRGSSRDCGGYAGWWYRHLLPASRTAAHSYAASIHSATMCNLHPWRVPAACMLTACPILGTHQVQFREGGEWRKRRQRGSSQLRGRLQLPQICELRQVGVQICLAGLHSSRHTIKCRRRQPRLGYARPHHSFSTASHLANGSCHPPAECCSADVQQLYGRGVSMPEAVAIVYRKCPGAHLPKGRQLQRPQLAQGPHVAAVVAAQSCD